MSRINQSIEAFAYCVLGSQVDLRSSTLGEGGIGKEVQSQFLNKVEKAIILTDLPASVQRYQNAIQDAKVRLNLAVCPSALLMPGNMVINTESDLKQAEKGFKRGINDWANKETKKWA